MQWEQLLCDKRQGGSGRRSGDVKNTDLRSEFQKDYHRIICSASFRRLQDKTQVYPLDSSDFVRTRLTHSLEVASFARSLGNICFKEIEDRGLDPQVSGRVREDICSILECAGLLHDIGNPPFGHFGEDTIRCFFRKELGRLSFEGESLETLLSERMRNDLYHFEGNAQALRLLTKLHYLVDENGMHLTYALLNTLVKYPVDSTGTDPESGDVKLHKMGYYLAEDGIYREISEATGAVGCRYPLTFLLEAADDIAYRTADIEDGVKKGFISYGALTEELRSASEKEGLGDGEKDFMEESLRVLEDKLRAAQSRGISDPEMNAVQNWVISIQGRLLGCAAKSFVENYAQIMAGEFGSELLKVSAGRSLVKALGSIAVRYVFRSKQILTSEIAENTMLTFLLERFVGAAVRAEEGAVTPVDSRLMEIVSDNYRFIFDRYAKGQDKVMRVYLRLLLITDFICGMTDSYAKDLYRRLAGLD